MNVPLLELHELHAGYGRVNVLKGVSCVVHEREIVTLIGANGAGKTTTLLAISGVVETSGGSIRFAGESLNNVPSHERVTRGLAQVPEGRKIFPRLTVLENLELGAYTRCDRNQINNDRERVFSLFPILAQRRVQLGGTLSGGEQQMLAIGRALMSRPKLLLLDEPSMGIAPIILEKIFTTIRELNHEGMTILLVEQNARLALNLANRGYVMETGQIVLVDQAKSLLTNPRVQQAYLG